MTDRRQRRWPLTIAIAIAIAVTLAATAPAAIGAGAASLKVIRPWLRATAPGTTVGVAYFEITGGDRADELVGIRTAAAGRVEIHSSATVDGVMQMRELKSVPVPAHGRVRFAPSGLHAMLLDLRAPLIEGQEVELTLLFRHGGAHTVRAPTQGLGTMAAPDGPVATHDGHR